MLAAGSAICAVASVRTRRDPVLASRLGEPSLARSPARFLQRACARIGAIRWVRRRVGAERIELAVERAGWDVPVDTVVGSKVLLAAAFGALSLLGPMPLPIVFPVTAAAGFRLPDILAARAARGRSILADAEVPQLLDLLAAASSAGLSGPLALRRSLEATRGPLAEELGRVVRAVDLGGRWREELRRVADRLALPDLRKAVAALTRSDTLGVSLVESTSSLAAEVREARRAAATERARKAPVKMLFPLVFLVLQAFLLLTVVPVLLTTLQSIR